MRAFLVEVKDSNHNGGGQMGKFKFLIAIGLSLVLLIFPLSGMAENPLPQNESADGHPWDDGNDEDESNPVDTANDTVPAAQLSRFDDPGFLFDKTWRTFASFLLTGNWYLFIR